MSNSEEIVDLEPSASDDLNPTSVNSNAAQRQIAERQNDIQVLLDVMPDLRFNKLTQKMEFGPRTNPTVLAGDDLDLLTCKLAVERNVFIPEARIKAAVKFAAKTNAFCPIRRYLLECSYSAKPSEDWDRLGELLIGNPSPLATKVLQRFLIGAVARAHDPGCTMSWIPIFIGQQGSGKSQLLRELVPKELFAEMTVSMDILMKEIYRLHVSWLIELPEVDNYFQIKNIENFKNLITTRIDETRMPYQSLPISLARSFVMAGTSNRSEFLVDPTGNRRFIPLELGDGFETPWRELPLMRDSLWKRAMQEYSNGTPWEITSGELAEISDYVKQFSITDPWEPLVATYVSSQEEVHATDVLIKGLGLTAQYVSTRDTRRIASILTAMGWRRLSTSRKDPVTGRNKSVRLWKRPKNSKPQKETLGDF
jgi:predicted P-loop ATPase